MKVTFLGTGTSVGVPVIGCRCRVCTSKDSRNRRMRQSVWIRNGQASILIDASSDFRQQALKFGIQRLDAILVTHAHADHILGLDDTRIFAYRQRAPVPLYGTERTLQGIKKTFWYAFDDVPEGGGRPKVDLIPVRGRFQVGGLQILPLEGDHGFIPVTGYRIDGFAYLTDCKRIPQATVETLRGVECLVLNALRREPEHPTHMTVGEALAAVSEIAPERAYLVHMGHELDHEDLESSLPEGVSPAYDGLTLTLPDPTKENGS